MIRQVYLRDPKFGMKWMKMPINQRDNTGGVCCKVPKVTNKLLCTLLLPVSMMGIQLWLYLLAPSILSAPGCVALPNPTNLTLGIVATGLTEAAASGIHGAEDFPGHAKDNEHHISPKGAGSRQGPVCAMEVFRSWPSCQNRVCG